MINRNILLLFVCQALFFTATSLSTLTSPLIGQQLAFDPRLATLPQGIQFLSAMLTTFPASMLMQRFGRARGFVTGSFLAMTGAAVMSFAILHGSFLLFCLGASFLGGFSGFAQYYRFAAVDASEEQNRAKAISLVLAGGLIGAILGPRLAVATRDLVAVAFAGCFMALIVVQLLSAFCAALIRIPAPTQDATLRSSGRPLGVIAMQPAFITAVLCATAGYTCMTLLMTSTPLAMQHHHHPFSTTGTVIQWHVVGMFAPAFFSGRLIQRFGVIPVMVSGLLAIAGCIVANLLGSSFANFWTALILLGIGWNFLFIGGTTLLIGSYEPQEKAKAQALNDLLVFTFVGASAISSGFLFHTIGWRTMNLALLLPLSAAAVALWIQSRRPPAVSRPVEEEAVEAIPAQ